jgi:uncharacterized protein (DUF342 family)
MRSIGTSFSTGSQHLRILQQEFRVFRAEFLLAENLRGTNPFRISRLKLSLSRAEYSEGLLRIYRQWSNTNNPMKDKRMPQAISRNGSIELKFNEDRTQALATIYPSSGNGCAVDAAEVKARLKSLGVTYGVRDHAILEAIHYAEETGMAAANMVVAQGTLPQNGTDARVQYHLPLALLSRPLPKRSDDLPIPDWFALDPEKIVSAGQALATLFPPQPGIPGKTLTWPIQSVAPKPGRPVVLSLGPNVDNVDGMKLCASQEGYVCLQGELLMVHALRILSSNASGNHTFHGGAVFMKSVHQAQIRAHGFIAIKDRVIESRLRADGDVLLHHADNCDIIASGNVFVTGSLRNCNINTRSRLITRPSAEVIGGNICAMEGVKVGILGAQDFTATEIHTGIDHFVRVRNLEIQEELVACDENIKRISQALKPFATMSVHVSLPEEKRALLQKLQAQKHSQEAQINALHNEKRTLTLTGNEKAAGTVHVMGTVWPGVWIEIGASATQIEIPMESIRFLEAPGGKSVQAEYLSQAA